MQNFLINLGDRHGVQVRQAGAGWQVDLPLRNALKCRMEIGPDTLDWFVTIEEVQSGFVVHKDWNDYLGYDDRTELDLIADKKMDIDSFIERWTSSTNVRVSAQRQFSGLVATTSAEWQHDDSSWSEVVLCAPKTRSGL